MAKLRLNSRKYRNVTKNLVNYVNRKLPREALNEFKDNTPKQSGYARQNTKLSRNTQGFEITGDYPYAGVLDKGLFPKNPVSGTGKTSNGFSTQAPKGMIEPTVKYIEDQIKKRTRSLLGRRK